MIRYANKFDLEIICDLLEDFCRRYPNDSYKESSTWDREFAKKQMLPLLAGAGFILIDESHKGILCAVKVPSFWIPGVFVLQELVWYSSSKRVAVELLNKFLELGRKMKDADEVKEVCFTSVKDADFYKFGLRRAGHNWVI